jgi:putative transposase
MPRPKRIALGGYVYHVLNRANGRLRIFRKPGDFLAFETILAEGIERFAMRICGYCIMSNHWHLVLWPRGDGDLPAFMRRITQIHTQRYHGSHGTVGLGHLYQGRYKSFPVQDEAYYLTVMRYVEANPLRAGLVEKADAWPWSSYAIRRGREAPVELVEGPVALPRNWPVLVGQSVAETDVSRIQNSIQRGTPLGLAQWVVQTAKRMALEATLRPKGRPRKSTGPF